MNAGTSRNTGTLLKTFILFAFLAAAALFVNSQFKKRQLILRENQAVEYSNEGDYAEALKIFLDLRSSAKGARLERLNTSIADCYCSMAEEPSLSYAEQVELYRQAYKYDPSSVMNPKMIEQIKRAE